MLYFVIVALHLTAMAAWMAALVGIPAALAAQGAAGPSADSLARLRAAFRRLATPGIVLVWVFGIWAAVQGDWFTQGWLHAKLAFVLALSALHGIVSARLRRLDGGAVPGLLRAAPRIALALAFGAILLAVWKPF